MHAGLGVAQVLQAGAMVKMDAGCELHGYCSDVTRCWPVSGAFSPPQRALYEAVLDINRRVPLLPAPPPLCPSRRDQASALVLCSLRESQSYPRQS